MTNRGEEAEFVLIALVPAEFHGFVPVVDNLKGSGFGLIDDAIPDHELIFMAFGESLECDSLRVALTHDHHLVLLVGVVLGVEGEQEFLYLSCLGDETDVEGMVGFRRDCVVHVAYEVETIVLYHIETGCCSNGALILEYYLHNRLLADSSLAELKNRSSISLLFLRFLNLKSGKSALTSEFEHQFSLLAIRISIIHNCLEYTSVCHHILWVESDSHILVLVRFDGEDVGFDIESEAFTLALRAGFDGELDCASDLVGVHDLESLLALGALAGDQSAEPEQTLKSREDT